MNPLMKVSTNGWVVHVSIDEQHGFSFWGSAIVSGNEHAREEEQVDDLFRCIVQWDTELVFCGGYDRAWISWGRNGLVTGGRWLTKTQSSVLLFI